MSRIRMPDSKRGATTRTFREVFQEFVLDATARGLSPKTLRNYEHHLHSVSCHFDIDVRMCDGSDEYNKVRDILAENPGMRLVVESGHKAKTPHHSRRLTYANMERYILVQDNAEELMTTFALVKEESKKEKSPYAYVRGWFFTQFEDCRDLRVFIAEEDGTTTTKKVPYLKAS